MPDCVIYSVCVCKMFGLRDNADDHSLLDIIIIPFFRISAPPHLDVYAPRVESIGSLSSLALM